ncbi:cytochrome c-type biogenesis protein CcmH [Comamonadaceae bacterium G21597-S1]|nr:cytochrome c-type biogenesis protein CcmH [Comamonadaceae bacterium G21597-S1]
MPGLAALALGLLALVAHGKEAQPLSDDPQLEARVLTIAEELRCLVCQNETIAASQADLAVDLRKQIRLKLQAGQSQREILDFMVERYGDFVLYRPPFKARTLLLWLGPFLLLVIAAVVMAVNVRRRRRTAMAQDWSEAQQRRARALLDEPAPPSQS